MVIPFPDDPLLLVMRHFDGVGPLSFLAAHEVADEQVSVLELLKAGDPGDVQIRSVLVAELPHNSLVPRHLDQALLRAAANERIAIGQSLRIARVGDTGVFPHHLAARIHLAHGTLTFMGGKDVAVRELMDVAHLKVVPLDSRGQRSDMDDLALRIHFDRLTRPLLGDQRVAIGQALAAEDLMRFANVIEHRLPARCDLANTGRSATVAGEYIAIRQRLEDDRGARWMELPHLLALCIEFDKPIGPLAVLGEEQSVFDGRVRSEGLRARRQREGQNGDDEAVEVHGGI